MNVQMPRSIGTDEGREDLTESEQRYDLILDMMGNHPLSELWRVKKPGDELGGHVEHKR